MESYKTAQIRTPVSTTEQTLHRYVIFTALVDQSSLKIVANATKKIVQSCLKSARLTQTNLFKQKNYFLSYPRKKVVCSHTYHLQIKSISTFTLKKNKNKVAQILIFCGS